MKSGGQQKGSGLAPNIASLLCYICFPIPSIIFLVIEKENKDVQFHAWQGTILGVSMFGLLGVLQMLGLIFGKLWWGFGVLFHGFFTWIMLLAVVIVSVICWIKSYQGERWKIPVIGDIAAKKAGV